MIDGNNLAGKLGILDEKDFNYKLVEKLGKYFGPKNKKALVVFDGHGDLSFPVTLRGIDIAFAGDLPYSRESADEKILLNIRKGEKGESFILVTEDAELLSRSKLEAVKSGVSVKYVKASNFAKLLESVEDFDDNDYEDEKDVIDDLDELNKELLDAWSNKK